jgi:hypothetical protein
MALRAETRWGELQAGRKISDSWRQVLQIGADLCTLQLSLCNGGGDSLILQFGASVEYRAAPDFELTAQAAKPASAPPQVVEFPAISPYDNDADEFVRHGCRG